MNKVKFLNKLKRVQNLKISLNNLEQTEVQ